MIRGRLAARTDTRTRALRLYRQFVPRDGLCFDIGANVGARSELFVELGARVVAVEPQPECASALRAKHPSIEVVEAAVGPKSGTASLLIASYNTLTSVSREWVDAVRASGRFAEFEWNAAIDVPMVTLDELIERFGVPDFCKIDVEGYELGVMSGLSHPVGGISFEFDVERREPRIEAVGHLSRLGMEEFNFSFGESFVFRFDRWRSADAIAEFLTGPEHSTDTFGDVYARRRSASAAARMRGLAALAGRRSVSA